MYASKVSYIFTTIEKAGVSFTDFARITKISRETLYRWKGGGTVKDMLRLDLAYTYALRLEKACRAGRLPLVNKLKAEQRLKMLRTIIAEMSAK